MTAAVQSDLKGATGPNHSGKHVRVNLPEPGLDTVGRTAAAVSAMIQAVHVRQQTPCVMEREGHTEREGDLTSKVITFSTSKAGV